MELNPATISYVYCYQFRLGYHTLSVPFEKLWLWKLETISKHWSTRDPSNLSMWFPNNECSLKNLDSIEILEYFYLECYCLNLQLQLGRWDNFIPVSSSHQPVNFGHRLFCQAESSSSLTGLSWALFSNYPTTQPNLTLSGHWISRFQAMKQIFL